MSMSKKTVSRVERAQSVIVVGLLRADWAPEAQDQTFSQLQPFPRLGIAARPKPPRVNSVATVDSVDVGVSAEALDADFMSLSVAHNGAQVALKLVTAPDLFCGKPAAMFVSEADARRWLDGQDEYQTGTGPYWKDQMTAIYFVRICQDAQGK